MLLSLWGWIYVGGAGLCWSIVLIAWSVGAFIGICQRRTRRNLSKQVAEGVLVLAYGGLIVLLCTLLLLVLRSMWHLLSFDIPWLRPPGLLLLLISTIFTLWARATLGLMWSPLAVIKPDHLLRTDGPYSITRHPIYTGLLGMIIGSLLMFSSHQWFVMVIGILLVAEAWLILHLKIKREEHLLLATFGENYAHYQKCVPQLLPFGNQQWLTRRNTSKSNRVPTQYHRDHRS